MGLYAPKMFDEMPQPKPMADLGMEEELLFPIALKVNDEMSLSL